MAKERVQLGMSGGVDSTGAVLLLQLIEKEVVSKENMAHAMERILVDYVKMRKNNKHMLLAFRNIYFLLVLNEVVTIPQIVELWKNKDHYDGLLSELVFDLLNSWKNMNKEAAVKALEAMKLTVDAVFVGGCPMMVAEKMLAKHGMAEKNGVIVFASSVCYKQVTFSLGSSRILPLRDSVSRPSC